MRCPAGRARAAMLEHVQRAIGEYRLLLPGQRVLAAVSGGADSVALLCALAELSPSYPFVLAAAHLDHGIRGRVAEADARFVRRLCKRLGIPCVCGRTDVPSLARRKKLSLEMAAREARYAFLARAARRFRSDAIATAHTADDQVETVLLKLARGAGPRGLSGIPWATSLCGVRVIRPMLDVSREQVLSYLQTRRVRWRNDETNRDPAFLRNRVRGEILPLLESRLNPQIRRVLVRTAEILRAEDEWMDTLARRILARCTADSGRTLLSRRLRRHPLAARRRMIRLWLSSLGVDAEKMDFEAVERIEALMGKTSGSETTAVSERQIVCRRYDRLSMERRGPCRNARSAFTVRVPGKTDDDEWGLRVRTAIAPGLVRDRPRGPGALPARASLAWNRVEAKELRVRSWRRGDWIRPLGLGGSKKLQDILVDAKVPKDDRAGVPVFECDGEIVWVPGYRVAQGWEVRDASAPGLQIAVDRIGAGAPESVEPRGAAAYPARRR